jgi:hypothetical protein
VQVLARSTSAPLAHDADASEPAEERRHSYRPRRSLAARVNEPEEDVVIDGCIAGRYKHAILLD